MFKKIKNYLKKINEQSIIDNILQEYRSGEVNYSNVPLYEAQIRLANLKLSNYEFDKKISGMTGKPMRCEYPHDIIPMQEMFSNYRGNKNKNFLHELVERKIPNDSLKLWLKFLPREQLLHKDNHNFSPLIYGLIFNIDIPVLLKQIDIKLDQKEIKKAYSAYDTKKGFEALRFAVTIGDKSVKDFYDKYPKTINIPFNKNYNTALTVATSALQFDTISYLLSKGAMLNSPENKDIGDDLVTIIDRGAKHFSKEEDVSYSTLYLYLKSNLLPLQPHYKLKINVPTLISISDFSYQQLDAFFGLCEEACDINVTNKISHVFAFFNNDKFLKYCVDKKISYFDYKHALYCMSNEERCSVDVLIKSLEKINNNNIDIQIYLQEKNNDGNTFIHSLFKNKSITPNYIKWFKDNNINIFIQNNDGERAFDYLSKESKKEAQKLYIEEYVKKEREEISKILTPVSKTSISAKTRL